MLREDAQRCRWKRNSGAPFRDWLERGKETGALLGEGGTIEHRKPNQKGYLR